MIEEHGMHGLADIVVATEREGQVADPTADMSTRQVLLDPSRCTDEIDSIVIVFFDTRCYRKNIRIENNIIRIETHLRSQNAIGALANFNFALIRICLPLLVESHDHNGSS